MNEGNRVVVLNHFAVPRDQPGHTRHVELFGRLTDWDFTIIASKLNQSTGKPQRPTDGFLFVPVVPYRSNGIARVMNWISYAVTATIAAVRLPRPDVVYASSPHLLAGVAGLLIARTQRARFIFEVRDLWPKVLLDMGRVSEKSVVYRILDRLALFLYARAERIVVMAPGTRTALQAMGVPADKIEYIPNAADAQDFVPSTNREALRDRYSFTRLTGVYAGAHGPANGLDLLLDAADEVRELSLDIVLIGDGVLKKDLVATAKRQRLSNVRFMDPIPKTEIPDLLSAADFGIHVLADVALFRTSVSPNKIFDYMAAGLPVLTNCPGVVATTLIEASAGVAVAPRELAQGFRQMAIEPSVRSRARGGYAPRAVPSQHSRSVTALKLQRVLKR